MLLDFLEKMTELDELDVCLSKKVPGFGEELDLLNEVID
jgi:hypothetical protein